MFNILYYNHLYLLIKKLNPLHKYKTIHYENLCNCTRL